MKYQYNYSFLEKWIEVNRKISYKKILKAIGSTSNISLSLYESKKTPMPVISLLRFCNTFNVPISAFIVNNEENEMHIRPNIDDQLEPDGGYINSSEKRGKGTRALRDPLDIEEIPSTLPPYYIINKIKSDYDKKEELNPEELNKNDLDIPKEYIYNEKGKLINIIAEQQKQIAEQQKQIAQLTQFLLQEKKKYNIYEPETKGTLSEKSM